VYIKTVKMAIYNAILRSFSMSAAIFVATFYRAAFSQIGAPLHKNLFYMIIIQTNIYNTIRKNT